MDAQLECGTRTASGSYYRRASQIAEWVLVAAVVLMHLAIFLWPEAAGNPQLLVCAAHDAQMLSGIVLILGWCILGPGSPWLRGGALPILSILWLLPWNERMLPRETSTAFPVVVAMTGTIVIVGLRLFGFSVRRLDPSAGGERGPQFSLFGLLVVTTLIAAAIGGLEALRPTIMQDRGSDFSALVLGEIPRTPQQVREIVLAVVVALSAIGGLWVVARPGAAWFRLAATLLAVPIAAVYLAYMSSEADQRTMVAVNLGLALALVAGFAGLSVLPLRLLDYRLMRPAAAPAGGARLSKRSRLAARGAAIVAPLSLLALLPCSSLMSRGKLVQLSPPAKAFAAWIQPRDPLAMSGLYRLRVRTAFQRIQVRSYVQPQPPDAPHFDGWEYRSFLVPLTNGGPTKVIDPADENHP